VTWLEGAKIAQAMKQSLEPTGRGVAGLRTCSMVLDPLASMPSSLALLCRRDVPWGPHGEAQGTLQAAPAPR
jgi:hypothetical protein